MVKRKQQKLYNYYTFVCWLTFSLTIWTSAMLAILLRGEGTLISVFTVFKCTQTVHDCEKGCRLWDVFLRCVWGPFDMDFTFKMTIVRSVLGSSDVHNYILVNSLRNEIKFALMNWSRVILFYVNTRDYNLSTSIIGLTIFFSFS